jgi:hypothetical protein
MHRFAHGIAVFVCIATIAFSAFAQTTEAFPGSQNALANVAIKNMQRTVLHGNIAHYTFEVVVGPGKFDVIRMHRIVREKQPYEPIQTVGGVLLLPGGPNFFEAIFMAPLISQVPAWDQSIVAFLAKNKVDVWGMDYSWALVPAQQTTFKFMKSWGVARDSQHAHIALSLARAIRGVTGQGSGRLEVLGFSYGGAVAYAAAGNETQQPRALRNIKGLISADMPMKFQEKFLRDYYCTFMAADQTNLDAGTYNDDGGVFDTQLYDLAISAPADPSPFFPGLTNYVAIEFLGASTWLLNSSPIFWHFVAGYLDANQIPSDLRYTDSRVWRDLVGNVPPHFPMQADWDTDALFCGVDVPFNRHLQDIAVPILYVGAAGGFGTYGYYTTTLTASTDITKFTVQFQPDDQRMVDFAHGDLFLAKNAETLVWRPALDWIIAHH